MDTKKFWDTYLATSKDNLYDFVKENFVKKFPPDFMKEDFSECLFEMLDYLKTQKEHEKIIEIADLLKAKKPIIYDGVLEVFEKAIIEYHCFTANTAQMMEAVQLFANKERVDLYYLTQSVDKIALYGYNGALDAMVTSAFHTGRKDTERVMDADNFLAGNKYYLVMERYFNQAKNGEMDWEDFYLEVKAYEFGSQEDIPLINEGLFSEMRSLTELKAYYVEDNSNSLIYLGFCFMRFMYAKGMSFSSSRMIWGNMISYWERNEYGNMSISDHFTIIPKEFESYLLRGSSFMSPSPDSLYSTLWGSLHIYDFLRSSELINEHDYQAFLKMNKELRAILLDGDPCLWDYGYVHVWPRPAGMSEEEFQAEREIFLESYNSDYSPPRTLVQEEKTTKKGRSLPQRKIGRNELISVKYDDGTIKKIKFKKVKVDLENGACVLLK